MIKTRSRRTMKDQLIGSSKHLIRLLHNVFLTEPSPVCLLTYDKSFSVNLGTAIQRSASKHVGTIFTNPLCQFRDRIAGSCIYCSYQGLTVTQKLLNEKQETIPNVVAYQLFHLFSLYVSAKQ